MHRLFSPCRIYTNCVCLNGNLTYSVLLHICESENEAQPSAISLNNLVPATRNGNPIYVSYLCQFSSCLLFCLLVSTMYRQKIEQYFILCSIKQQNQFKCSINLTDKERAFPHFSSAYFHFKQLGNGNFCLCFDRCFWFTEWTTLFELTKIVAFE